jgi:23S rRNA U2552 (ribose-2'-O)-methylase RlmE/FtsJ
MPPKKLTNKKQEKEQKQEREEKELREEVIQDTTTDPDTLIVIDQDDIRPEEIKTDVYDKYPLIFDIPKTKNSIFDTEPNVDFSTTIDYPRFEFGFHHYIHQGKNYFGDNVKKFEGKKQVWRVLNRYETKIDSYDQSISDIAKDYFDLKGKPDILSRAFYKLWEILMLFDLIDLKSDNFVSAHLAEGPGSFIQATIMFRDLFAKKGLSKNDKYHAITLHPEGRSFVPEVDQKFIDYYSKESPQRVFLHKTYNKQTGGKSEDKDNGDLTNPKTMRLFSREIGNQKCDLVTADGGFENINENLQEQESFRLVLAEIINCIKIQKKGGNFVCKFFETFTLTSMKMISILTELYEKVQFVKPLTSRMSNSEKYAVCTGFKYSDNSKEYLNIMNTLENILETMHKNSDLFVVGLFEKYTVPKNLIMSVTSMNVLISNLQIKSINIIVEFIRKQIYSGDQYYQAREDQIIATKYWVNLFLPKNLGDVSKSLENAVNTILSITRKKDKLLSNELNLV